MKPLCLAVGAMLLVGCVKEEPEPDPSVLEVPALGSKVLSIGPPSLPDVVTKAKGNDHACIGGTPKNVDPKTLKVAAPEKLTLIPVPSVLSLGDPPPPPETLSVDTEPPGGGDGSFRVSLGTYGASVGEGIWAAHTHREPHMLWIADAVKPIKKAPQYKLSALVLYPDARIEIDLEQLPVGGKKYVQFGQVVLEQKEIPGYAGKLNNILISKKKHPLTCQEDYVWSLTSSNTQLDVVKGEVGVWASKSALSAQMRMAKMRVFTKAKGKEEAPVEIEFRSGCAKFQICGNWADCKGISPQCATDKDPGKTATYLQQ
jgi:hypothetical protein